MDLRRGTLYRLLESLDENNEQLGWHMYRNKRGRIIVKIVYDEETNLDLNCETSEHSHQTVSFRRKSTKEIQRNYQRAQNFRDNIQPAKRPRNSSPEITRHNLENSNSSPTPKLDVSKCEEQASCESIRDLSASSVCFEPESPKPFVEIKHAKFSATPDPPVQMKAPSKTKDQKDQSDCKKSQSTKSDELVKSKITKDSSKPDYCTYGWCAIGQTTIGCTCTREMHPCAYCIDSRSVDNKMCDSCKYRFDA